MVRKGLITESLTALQKINIMLRIQLIMLSVMTEDPLRAHLRLGHAVLALSGGGVDRSPVFSPVFRRFRKTVNGGVDVMQNVYCGVSVCEWRAVIDDSKGSDSATSNNTKLVHWLLIGVTLYALIYSSINARRAFASTPNFMALTSKVLVVALRGAITIFGITVNLK